MLVRVRPTIFWNTLSKMQRHPLGPVTPRRADAEGEILLDDLIALVADGDEDLME